MRSGAQSPILAAMTGHRTREYVLELDVEADPIAGRLRGHDRESCDFTGWLGLASALERMIATAGASNDEAGPITPAQEGDE